MNQDRNENLKQLRANWRPRVVFLGSPEVVVQVLQGLMLLHQSQSIEVVGVVSQPARPVGRKRKLCDPPVAEFAKSHGLLTLQPESARDADFLSNFAELNPDVAITAAYGQILSEEFLSIPKRATINIHPSLLPKYRGATPVPAALLADDQESGVTILFTVRAMDAGAIILQERSPVGADEVSDEMTLRLFERGTALLADAFRLLADIAFIGVPQDPTQVTHCKKISKEDGKIDWQASARKIYQRYRAYHPWPGSFTDLGGQSIQLFELSCMEDVAPKLKAGCFAFDKASSRILISCGEGTISAGQLRPAGGKLLDAAAFWNGYAQKLSHKCFE